MGWFADFITELKKQWSINKMSDPSTQPLVNDPTVPAGAFVDAWPTEAGTQITNGTGSAVSGANDPNNVARSIAGGVVSVVDTEVKTLAVRALSTVSREYEAAIADFEALTASREAWVQAFIDSEYNRLRAAAQVEYNKELLEKQSLVGALESEFVSTKSWLGDKFKALVAKL